MSAFSNVVGGKLNLKGGKALDVKDGIKKKKKRKQGLTSQQLQALQEAQEALRREEEGGKGGGEGGKEGEEEGGEEGGEGDAQKGQAVEDHRTPAEKRYHEQLELLELKKSARTASKSHRDRIEDFNQYLANLSEHYDIPKVGPG